MWLGRRDRGYTCTQLFILSYVKADMVIFMPLDASHAQPRAQKILYWYLLD